MNGFKYLIFLLPCLLLSLHVESLDIKEIFDHDDNDHHGDDHHDNDHHDNDHHDNDHHDDDHHDHHDGPGINLAALRSKDEKLTPAAAAVMYQWWISVPLDYMKYQTKKDDSKETCTIKSEDQSKLHQMIMENMTAEGQQKFHNWWLSMPIFKFKSALTKNYYNKMVNGGPQEMAKHIHEVEDIGLKKKFEIDNRPPGFKKYGPTEYPYQQYSADPYKRRPRSADYYDDNNYNIPTGREIFSRTEYINNNNNQY